MIDIYQYRQTVDLFIDQATGQLWNTTMFNSKLKLYKHMTTSINVKIRDRDRVTQMPSKVRFAILDENKVVMLHTYLDVNVEGKFFTVNISGGLFADMPAHRMYHFMFSVEDEDTGAVTPLYVDHNFSVHGELWLEESIVTPAQQHLDDFSEVVEIDLMTTGFVGVNAIGATFNALLAEALETHGHLYKLSPTFNSTDKVVGVSLVDSSPTPENKTVYLLRHKARHHAINANSQSHWNIVASYYDVTDTVDFSADMRVGHYMVCVAVNDPQTIENIEVILKTIN